MMKPYPKSPCYGPMIARAIGFEDEARVYCVEALMRGELGTLDGISAADFDALARDCDGDYQIDPALCIRIAASYGLGIGPRPGDYAPVVDGPVIIRNAGRSAGFTIQGRK